MVKNQVGQIFLKTQKFSDDFKVTRRILEKITYLGDGRIKTTWERSTLGLPEYQHEKPVATSVAPVTTASQNRLAPEVYGPDLPPPGHTVDVHTQQLWHSASPVVISNHLVLRNLKSNDALVLSSYTLTT